MNLDDTLVVAALKALVHDEDAAELYAQLMGVLPLIKRGHPLRLTGRASIMNALLDLAVADEDLFAQCIESMNDERADTGASTFAEGGITRARYMRDFMAQRRARTRRLREAWNALLPDRDKLRGEARLDFEAHHARRWSSERTRREQELREQLGRRLTTLEQQNIGRDLWAEVDVELDDFDQFVADKLSGPATARNPHDFHFPIGNPPHEQQAE